MRTELHQAFAQLDANDDAREGISAFLEKRKPAWKMRLSKDFPSFLPEVK